MTLVVTKPYKQHIGEVADLINDDPTEGRERFPDADALAEAMQWDNKDNGVIFELLKRPAGKALGITGGELKKALQRRKREWAKQKQDEAKALEKERKRLDFAERVIAEIGVMPNDEREFVAAFMAKRGYDMTWDRRYSQNGVPCSVTRITNDMHLTASTLALVKPKGDLLGASNLDRALGEYSDELRAEREEALWERIAAPTDGRDAGQILRDFREICGYYFQEPDFAYACILKYIWSVKRKLRRLPVAQVHLIALLGPQNSGKTWVCRKLIGPIEEASIECALPDLLDNRQMDMPAYLAVFLDEMVLADKIEATALKNLLTGATQARRPMRSNLSEKIEVRFSALATTNKRIGNLIYDPSGMRRFVEVPVKQRHEIEPNWERIANFDFLGLWQAVDEADDNDPLLSRFENELKMKQEDMRRPDNTELWAREYEFKPTNLVDAGKIKWRDNQYVDFYGQGLYEIFRAWEHKFDPAYRGTSLTKFGGDLKNLIDDGRLPAWAHYKYGSKAIYRLDHVKQARMIQDGENKPEDAIGVMAIDDEADEPDEPYLAAD